MNPRAEIKCASGIIIFCMINFFYLIPSLVIAEGSSPVYPVLINSLLLVFSLAYLIEGILQLAKEKKQGGRKQDLKIFWSNYWRPISLLVLMSAWILSLDWAGFLLPTVIFLFGASYIFGATRIKRVTLLSTLLPLIVFSLFQLVNAPLPEGVLEIAILAIIR